MLVMRKRTLMFNVTESMRITLGGWDILKSSVLVLKQEARREKTEEESRQQ